RRPSIAVTHRNLRSVYFRSYSLDLLAIVAGSRDYNLFPDATALRTMLRERSPEAAWSEDLPPTPDYRSHRTFVTPPLDRPGLHAVVVSASPDFGEGANRVVAAPIVISDLVLLTRPHKGGFEVTCVSGESGAALEGAEVGLYRYDYQKGHQR